MNLITLESNLKTATSLRQLEAHLEQYLNTLGIQMFAFTYYSYYPNSLNKLKYDFASKTYIRWHEHYINEHYEEIDSTGDKVYQTSLPTLWSLQEQLQAAKTPREKHMREDSVKFGIEQGLSIPIHGPLEDFAILMLAQFRGENWFDRVDELRYELFNAAYLYYAYIQQHLLADQKPDEKYQLNKREIQCLTLLAKQYSVESIAASLDITERTVNYHIQRLNKKLGTQNKYQSVIKALNKNLIKI